MSVTVPSRRRRALATATALAAAASLTLLVPATTTPASAAAPKIVGFSVHASQAAVRTSTGKKLRIDLYAGRYGTSDVSVTAAHGGEFHSWGFPVAKKSVVLSSTGRGKIAPSAAEVSPLAKINLGVRAAGKPKYQRCRGQLIGKTQRVSVSGTFWFDTRSGRGRWGSFGSKTKRFTFRTSALATWSYANTATDCGGSGYFPPCVTETVWGGFTDKVSFSGQRRNVTATRFVKLRKPARATRYDSRTVLARSVELTQDSEGVASLKITGNGRTLTGSATVTGQDPNTVETSCRGGRTMNSTYWSSAFFTNGARPLRTTDIFGALTVRSGTPATLSRNVVVAG